MLSGAKDCVPFPAPLSRQAAACLRYAPEHQKLDEAEHLTDNRKTSVASLRSAFGIIPESRSPSPRNGVHFQRNPHQAHGESHEIPWTLKKSALALVGATALIAWVSEILVGSVEAAAVSFGMTRVFVGVIVVAVIGNAAEHSTAVLMAMKNRMELSLGIAIGSSLQIALLVAPLLVILSHFIGPKPMDLVFTPAEVLAVFVSVLITGQIASDGKSNWLEGAQLLAVYLILALVFYFLPESVHE